MRYLTAKKQRRNARLTGWRKSSDQWLQKEVSGITNRVLDSGSLERLG